MGEFSLFYFSFFFLFVEEARRIIYSSTSPSRRDRQRLFLRSACPPSPDCGAAGGLRSSEPGSTTGTVCRLGRACAEPSSGESRTGKIRNPGGCLEFFHDGKLRLDESPAGEGRPREEYQGHTYSVFG
jgi:hypothetical protein